jgi:hypothetical protein
MKDTARDAVMSTRSPQHADQAKPHSSARRSFRTAVLGPRWVARADELAISVEGDLAGHGDQLPGAGDHLSVARAWGDTLGPGDVGEPWLGRHSGIVARASLVPRSAMRARLYPGVHTFVAASQPADAVDTLRQYLNRLPSPSGRWASSWPGLCVAGVRWRQRGEVGLGLRDVGGVRAAALA